MPAWWEQRRYGMFVHANLATVPAWSPIGQYADWYRSHLGDPCPTCSCTRRRWSRCSPITATAGRTSSASTTSCRCSPSTASTRMHGPSWRSRAGMGYTVFVAKHHDGFCWWDAPGYRSHGAARGPRRNVLAEYAAACERSGLVFGTYYSLLDWGDRRYPSDDVRRRGAASARARSRRAVRLEVSCGATATGATVPTSWRSQALIDAPRPRRRAGLRARRQRSVVARRARRHDVRVPDARRHRRPPVGAVSRHRPQLLPQPCRTGRAPHDDGREIVALLTEVVAKGGNLLLNVGPAADGTIPELQAAPFATPAAGSRHMTTSSAIPGRGWCGVTSTPGTR